MILKSISIIYAYTIKVIQIFLLTISKEDIEKYQNQKKTDIY